MGDTALYGLWRAESQFWLLRVVRTLVSQKTLPVGRSTAGNHLRVAE